MKKELFFLWILTTGIFFSCDQNSNNDSEPTETTELTGKWTSLSTNLAGKPRGEASSFLIGSKLYIFGGTDGKSPLNDLWEVDLSKSSPSWKQLADLDEQTGTISNASSAAYSRSSSVAFAIGSKGYVCSGFDGNRSLNDLWEYNPANDHWTQLSDIPGAARYGAYSFVVSDKGYVGGGFGEEYLQDLYSYNPATAEWKNVNAIGEGRAYASTFVFEDEALVLGGYNAAGFPDGFWRFNTTRESWTRKSITVKQEKGSDTQNDILRSNASAFVINGKGYLTCGSNETLLNTTWEYDPSTSLWAKKAPFSSFARMGAISTAVNGRGIILAGKTNNSYLDDFWEFEPNKN